MTHSTNKALPIAAVAVIDALGFKGIWRRHTDAAAILKTLKGARDIARTDAQWLGGFGGGKGELRASFFSDAVVLTAQYRDNPGTQDPAALVRQLAIVVALILSRASMDEVALGYRGCISLGPLLSEDVFFVGEAIDDAAERAETAQGAFVWCAPKAREALRGSTDELVSVFLPEWDVPLKAGAIERTRVVNPFAVGRLRDGWDNGMIPIEDLRPALLRGFGEDQRADVVAKRHNTALFLEHAYKLTDAYLRAHYVDPDELMQGLLADASKP